MTDFSQRASLLRPRKSKQLSILVGCLCFAWGGVLMLRQHDNVGYLCLGFFGVGACVMAANMLPQSAYLKIESDGFIVCNLFRRRRTRWLDVAEFGVFKLRGKSMVGWNYAGSYVGPAKLRSFNKGLTGYEAALPDTYGLKAHELADVLEGARAGCSTTESSASLLNGKTVW